MDGWMGGWVIGWMDRWVDGWMGGWHGMAWHGMARVNRWTLNAYAYGMLQHTSRCHEEICSSPSNILMLDNND